MDKSFRIKHEDNGDFKLFSRLLSKQDKQTSNNHPSFRVYYGDVSAVPFVWESQPGTPKHRLISGDGDVLRPPLTPPPSYYSNGKVTKNPPPRSNLLRALLSKISLKRDVSLSSPAPLSPSPSLSPSFSSSSSSSSSHSSSSFHGRRTRRFSCSTGSSASFDKGIEDISSAEPPTMVCCGIINRKKVLFSIVGRRRNDG